jgi:hypothetical protein
MEKYQLVLQFEAQSLEDYDRLVAFENQLIDQLDTLANVDGHDFGQGEFNIFILTDDPQVTFEKASQFLKTQNVPNSMRSAYREMAGDDYVVLWPQNLTEFSVT